METFTPTPDAPRVLGRVAHLIPEKMYGFVQLPDGREPFFHRSHCDPPGIYDELVASEPGKSGTVVTGVLYAGPQGKLRIGDVRLAGEADVDAYVDVVADARGNRL